MLPSRIVYVPTLAIRPSEMNGLEQLPARTKDKMRPLFLLAPWANAKSLGKAIERAQKAYPDRDYFIDIDRSYLVGNPEAEAQAEFLDIQNSEFCFDAWWSLLTEYDKAIPCLQLQDQKRECIFRQIDRAQNLNREFCIRIRIQNIPENLNDLIFCLNEVGSSDYTLVLDGEWVRDPLELQMRISGFITNGLAELKAHIPLVVSCTSMPKEYGQIEGVESIPFNNRKLVEQVSRNHNERRIVYGDWGSTRPRERSGGSGIAPNRVDYPKDDYWIIARKCGTGHTFQEAAEEIVFRSDKWDADLNLWGVNMILQTLKNEDFGINTLKKNVAARVNIHLHRQAFYGEDLGSIDLDEDWQD